MSQLSATSPSSAQHILDNGQANVGGPAPSQEHLRLSAHIPIPRPAILQEMASLANSISQSTRLRGASSDEVAGYLVPDFALLILGTACWRPLLCEEAQEIREQAQLNVAILRSDDRDFHGSETTTVDLLLLGSQTWISRLKPWRRTAADDLWFAPMQGEGRAVRLSAGLLALSPRAPFASLFEREYGFEVAQSVARQKSAWLAGGTSHG